MFRYGLYARKSKEDKSGVIKSIKDQLDIWRQLAAERGLLIVKEYEENKTAKIPGVRPVYNRLIADIQAGRIDAILVWHINRLARNMAEGGALAQMLIDGVLKEIRTPTWIYRPGDNILPLLLEQGMSTQYSLDLSQAVTRGMNSMAEEGGWPHQAKVGYLNARDPHNPKKGIVIKDPERFDAMRRGFDLMLTGAYTVRQVVDIMNGWGFKTKPTPTRPNSPLSYAAAYDIFHSPFYAGFTIHNGVQRRGKHEPMITAQEFNRIQDILHGKTKARKRRHELLYTGLMTCGFCGLQITAEQHYKSGVHRIYYHCSDTYLKCSKKGITESNLEDQLLNQLGNITVDPALCEIALDNIARWHSKQSHNVETILQQQHRTLESIETQRNNLLDLMLKGLITDEAQYKHKSEALLKERNQLQLDVAATLEELDHIKEQARAGLNFLERARDNFLIAPAERKKEIVRALGVNYYLRGKELSISLDPLLSEIVSFVDEIIVRLEPSLEGSQTCYRANFSQTSFFGRDTQSLLELDPPPTLIHMLKKSVFPSLHLP
ncbi:MAG: recombinase family protein [Armatimonadota bacterium]|nr:recombinase family protein [Armatimonadota bacterium]